MGPVWGLRPGISCVSGAREDRASVTQRMRGAAGQRDGCHVPRDGCRVPRDGRRVPAYAPRCDVPWVWEPTSGGWVPEGDNCTIRPGLNSVIVMEAAGEWSGCVITRDGDVLPFPPGTFR